MLLDASVLAATSAPSIPPALSMQWVVSARLYPVKRIPKACRLAWADVLSDVLLRVCAHPESAEAWTLLFALPKLCLRLPARGTRKKIRPAELVPFLIRLLALARDGQWSVLFDEACAAAAKLNSPFGETAASATRVRERVIALVEEGQLSKAVKALDSNGIHTGSEEVVRILAEKHPYEPPLRTQPCLGPPLRFTVPQVLKAVGAFHTGSSSGASKLYPAHLQDALRAPTADASGRLSGPLTFLVNSLAGGNCPAEVAPWLSGAPIFPLRKKDNGVRPIAVGETLRRLVSRCFCCALQPKFERLFSAAGQVGVCLKNGAEAAVHAVRLAIARTPSVAVLKVDFANAFNSVCRAAVYNEVRQRFPELEAWFCLTYSAPSPLLCNDALLPFKSTSGVQQGDPLGPALFALAILPLCLKLQEEIPDSLSIWYLDDGIVAGSVDDVSRAWSFISSFAPSVGLSLNIAKCELALPPGIAAPASMTGLARIPVQGFDLLGSPLGTDDHCTSYLKRRVGRIAAALSQLPTIDDPQVELTLLRSCLAFPKLAFALRSAPPVSSLAAAEAFDKLIQDTALERFALIPSPDQLSQICLPISHGGLGLRSAMDLVEASYIANIAAAAPLVSRLLKQPALTLQDFPDAARAYASLRSKVTASAPLPDSLASFAACPFARKALAHRDLQRQLSRLVADRSRNDWMAAPLASSRDALRKAAVSRPGAGNWQSVPPIPQLGFKFAPDEFLVLMRWWLGLPVYPAPAPCPEHKCGEDADPLGDHAVCCHSGPSMVARHDNVNLVWCHALRGCGFSCQREVFTDPLTSHRSADTFVSSWKCGNSAAHDWVISHVAQKAALAQKDPNWSLLHAEGYKVSAASERCAKRSIAFIPLAGDTFGGFGVEATAAAGVAASAGRLYRGFAGDRDSSLTASGILQRLRVEVLKGVARQLLRRLAVEDLQ